MPPKDNGPAGNGAEILTTTGDEVTIEYSPRDALRDYLDLCLSDGVLVVAVGSGPYRNDKGKFVHKNWTETPFDWRTEPDQAVREIFSNAMHNDVYVCPYPMRTRKRRKGNSVTRELVHADVDTDDPGTAEKVKALNGFAVATGTEGHAHVYVKLSESVSVDDLEALCRALGKHFGAPDVKCRDNDVLRPPGTYNYKPTVDGGERLPVKWLVPHDGTRVDPKVLASQLDDVSLDNLVPKAKEKAKINGEAITGTEWVVEEVNLDDYPDIAAAIDKDTGDRSEDTARIVGACVDAGMTLAETRWCVNEHSGAAQRLAERHDDDVLTLWEKITEDRDMKRRLAGKRSPTTDLVSLKDSASCAAGDFAISKPGQDTYTDSGNAASLVKTCSDEQQHVPGTGKWLRWDGMMWRKESDGGAVEYEARKLADDLPIPEIPQALVDAVEAANEAAE
jgi:hypothetical protein